MNTKLSGFRFFSVAAKAALALGLCGGIAAAGADPAGNDDRQTTTAEDFLRVPVRPVAIGHHGVGPNLGGDPTIPLENTVESVRQAYSLGARVVEVDVQLTKDGMSPHCDPTDDLEQTIVSTAAAEIHQAKMDDQVLFDSFSPALLLLASQTAPAIPRELDISGLQLLTPVQIEGITGLPVTIMTNKKNSLGLTWAEIGPVFRLPGYSSPLQFLQTGLATSVRVVGGEMDFLGPAEQQQPGNGSAFVAGAHAFGFRVFGDPAQSAADWNFFAGLGVDAIYSTIPLGVQLEPAIPNPVH